MRVVSVNKKTMPDKTPAPDFSLPHTTLSQSQVWSLRVLSFDPRPLASGSLIRFVKLGDVL
jgi:hypothetical protein